MKSRILQLKSSAGLTLVELVTSMVIASVAALGLGTGITSIVGFYQDDWVTKEVRFWGYESMDYLVKKIETAKVVNVREYLANYDGLLITPKDGSRQLNIQANQADGLTENGLPLLSYADFPVEGTYRDDGQRLISLEKFAVGEISDEEDYRAEFRGKPYLRALRKSLYVIEMVISVTTRYKGETAVEYLKFKRVVWAKDKYFR